MSTKSSLANAGKDQIENLGTVHPTSHPWKKLFLSIMPPASGFASLIAWMLPQSKPNAVLGRLNYWEFGQAVFLSALFFTLTIILFSSEKNRRARSFRGVAIWLGVLAGIILSESVAFFLPLSYLSDNPWYGTAAGSDSMEKYSDQLMFERPPHLKWHGLSRGDFAFPNDREDPYARRITFQTDFEGFRNSVDRNKAELIFIGDSFTEAGNMPEHETFVMRSARTLDLRARNLGRASHGPSEEIILLRKYGLKCQPRLVVWQFCENNDLDEEIKFRNWNDSGRPPVSFQHGMSRIAAWKRRSPTHFLFKRLRRQESWPFNGTFRDAQGKTHPMFFSGPPDESIRPTGHPGWPLMAETLGKGAELLSEREIELIVLLIPMKIRVMGPYVKFSEFTRKYFPSNWDLLPEETLAWSLKQRCKILDIPFIDATTGLKEHAASGTMVYLPLDSHLSSEGHRVVAELIVEAIHNRLTRIDRSQD